MGKKKENLKAQRSIQLECAKKRRLAQKKHREMLAQHARARKILEAKKAAKREEHKSRSTESQLEAIQRHRREVELSLDAGSLEETLRTMLAKHGEIEMMKKNIRGGLDVRFVTEAAAKSLLKTQKRNNKITATMSFPVTPVVIKQHCLYYKPKTWVIDQEVLNATAEYFSSISVVQQVKKLRNAVLIVFEDQESRDEMVKQSAKSNWTILGRDIGVCVPGLPPPINKRKAKKQPTKKKKKKNKQTNGRH